MNINARDKYMYFIFRRPFEVWLCLLRHKSESIEMFNRYRNEIKKQTGKSIKILRCDRGGEYLSCEFLTYLGENRILSLWNRTLLDMVRSMMSFATLPESFWGLAPEIACNVLNNVPGKSVNKTPYVIWTGRKLRL